jgi:hypothetical protein
MDVDAWSEEADDDHLFAALGITAAAQQDIEQAVLEQVSAWTCLCDGQQAPVLKCSLMLCAVVVSPQALTAANAAATGGAEDGRFLRVSFKVGFTR